MDLPLVPLLARQAPLGGAPTFWVLVLCALLLAGCAAALWLLLARVRELGEPARRLAVLEKIHAQLARLTGERSDIDLRRIEHALLDVRDGLAKVEGVLLDVVQAPREASAAMPVERSAGDLGERVVNRLVALGYERIEVAGEGPSAKEGAGERPPQDGEPADGSKAGQALSEEDRSGVWEVRVEAYRRGVLHKGRVVLREGRIEGVDMSPMYSAFP